MKGFMVHGSWFTTKAIQAPGKSAVFAIKIYQKTLSPDHGPFSKLHPYGYCRFHPTCSQFGIDAIEHFGLVKGSGKTAWRVLRCNPFNKGGEDPAV